MALRSAAGQPPACGHQPARGHAGRYPLQDLSSTWPPERRPLAGGKGPARLETEVSEVLGAIYVRLISPS